MKKKAGYMSFRFSTYSEIFILIILLLLILTGCGGSGSSGASAPPAAGLRITGKIALTNGAPVGGVNVQLYTSSFSLYSTTVNGGTFYGTKSLNGIESVKSDAIVQTVPTNDQGVFVFYGVPSGTYTIQPLPGTHLFRWQLAPSLNYIGVVTLTESGMAYLYNPEAEWSSNKLSADGTIIYNTVEPIAVIANTLDGQNFEAAVPGDVGINW